MVEIVTIKMTVSRWDAARKHPFHHHHAPRGLSTGGGGSVVLRRRIGKHRQMFYLFVCVLASLSILIQPCFGKGHIFKRRYHHRIREPITQAPRNNEADLSRYRPSNYNRPMNTTTSAPSLLDKLSLKWSALLCIALIGVAVGILINVANLHTDFQDLRDFYKGYEGRRVLIAEGTLTSREYLKALKTIQERRDRQRQEEIEETGDEYHQQREHLNEEDFSRKSHKKKSKRCAKPSGISSLSMLAAASSRVAYTANVMGNGHLRGGGAVARPDDQSRSELEHHQLIGQAGAPTLEDAATDHHLELISALAAIQEENRKRDPHNHCNFAAFTSVRWLASEEPVGQPHHLEWLQHHLPLFATNFIEDHDPEWRDLDYSIEIGEPPDDLWEFILQYDYKIFRGFDKDRDFCARRNLLYQFRKWKKRRRKLWRIVVTERAKKEMASQDKGTGGLGGGGSGGGSGGRR